MKNNMKALAVTLLVNSIYGRSDWIKKEYPNGDKFAMRWYSYVPEEDAEEDTDVFRSCLSYQDTLKKGSNGDLVASTSASNLEVLCAYTKTS